MIPWLGDDPEAPFPPTESALGRPNGLLAAGGDLSVPRLLNAYRRGVFPWYSEGQPILWWTPDPRCVLFTDRVHVSRRLARRMRKADFELHFDKAFEGVVRACAAPRDQQDGTWITNAMQTAYFDLHEAGHAHSLEVWRDGELIGGIYGVAIGRMFFGESMFSQAADASKVALVALCRQLACWEFPLLDCQVPSAHLARMGAALIPRRAFMDWLHLTERSGPSDWRFTGLAGTIRGL